MFTGIIQARGTVSRVEQREGDRTLTLDCAGLAAETITVGDSIAVNGCCLTAVRVDAPLVEVDVSAETLRRTLIGQYRRGTAVNLELAMRPDSRVGGHLLSGHVDGLATVVSKAQSARSTVFVFELGGLGRFIAEKGSVSIDGVSLTVNEVSDAGGRTRFGVNIIPHTLEYTTFGEYSEGTRAHIEVDLIARYIERLYSFQEK